MQVKIEKQQRKSIQVKKSSWKRSMEQIKLQQRLAQKRKDTNYHNTRNERGARAILQTSKDKQKNTMNNSVHINLTTQVVKINKFDTTDVKKVTGQ